MIMLYFSFKVVVPPPCDAKTASKHSNTALRAAHVRLSSSSDTCSSTHLGVARECSWGSRYSFTVSVKRVNSLNERLSHQRVVRGQHPNTQTPPYGPRARVPKLRYMLVYAPHRVARRALGGAVILLRCRLSESND